MDELRNLIKQIMDEKGLTALQIEKASGRKIKDSYISDILSGKTKSISVDKVNALAEGLGIDSIEVFKAASGEKVIFTREDPWPGRILLRTMGKIMDNPELTEIVKELVDLKPTKLRMVKKLIDTGK